MEIRFDLYVAAFCQIWLNLLFLLQISCKSAYVCHQFQMAANAAKVSNKIGTAVSVSWGFVISVLVKQMPTKNAISRPRKWLLGRGTKSLQQSCLLGLTFWPATEPQNSIFGWPVLDQNRDDKTPRYRYYGAYFIAHFCCICSHMKLVAYIGGFA